jgi:heme-degrading monooxygenase HmoA
MMVVLFRSKLVDTPDGYAEMAAEMLALAKTMPGFIDVKAFNADDGERLTLVWWQDEETLKGWREQARHRVAQRLGRERWYEYYNIEVAEVIRKNSFERRRQSQPAGARVSRQIPDHGLEPAG